ncbi:membrane protein containing Mechanosensitive ion channel MscS [Candidatus Magnetomorum sp. HK-1]|nr:membrane protein containing Mechanosensitive ion channel MscS [Candidatus Magnetomorum sp. HK-1]
MKNWRFLFFSILILLVLPVSFWACNQQETKIRIALVGPMTGKNEMMGKSLVQGVQLFLDRTRELDDDKFKDIEVDIFDDQNNAQKAEGIARIIAKQNSHVAVIGHLYSSCSISAGKIYKQYGIPAITPASTNVKVTQDNPWYFRTIFNDNLQSRFLAIYAREIFHAKSVSVIREDLQYGTYLADIFMQKAKEIGIRVNNVWSYEVDSKTLDKRLKQIVDNLERKRNVGLIFLAGHSAEGSKIIKMIKDRKLNYTIVMPDSFASAAFQKSFEMYPKERETPGFYTNGLYVTTPLIMDTANEKGQDFEEGYIDTFKQNPGWHAAFAYDAAMVLYQAIQETKVQGKTEKLVKERITLRDWLEKLNSVDLAIEGVTGFNYFNEFGDAQKPVSIGIYKNKNIVSSLTQLQIVNNIMDIDNVETELKRKRLLYIDDQYMYLTKVVYTGVKLNKIEDLDIKSMIAKLDFYLWFRFQGNFETQDFEFSNAVDDLNIEGPIKRKNRDDIEHHLYKVSGRFRLDPFDESPPFGRHVVGFHFRHKDLSRNNLIFVVDVLGMGDELDTSTNNSSKLKHLLNPSYKWCVDKFVCYQDTSEVSTLGIPEYLNMQNGVVKFSRFNYGVLIKKSQFNFREVFPRSVDQNLIILGIIFIFITRLLHKKEIFKNFHNAIWTSQVLVVWLIIKCFELILLDWLFVNTTMEKLALVKTIFDVLWWLIPAICINMAVNRFIWIPLEEKSGRKIPTVARSLLDSLVIILAIFGIVAYVFGEKVTGLLATSSVAAMIIGLGVQMNLSNIFSGIALNIERPFRTGDWVKISNHDEGKILDVSWRATRIQSRDTAIVHIPNGIVSESIIKNYSYPNKTIEQFVDLDIDSRYTPARVQKIIIDALLSVEEILKFPKPFTRMKGMTDWSVIYGVYYYLDDYAKKLAVAEAVWKRVRAHLKRAGISKAIKRQLLYLADDQNRQTDDSLEPLNIIQDIDVFKPFSDEAKTFISQRVNSCIFQQNEYIVRQGDEGDSLFIITEGAVKVQLKTADEKIIDLAVLGAGKFFGEMALLTGEMRSADVIAISETHLIEVTRDDIAPIMQQHPNLSKMLADVLNSRKQKNDMLIEDSECHDIDDQDSPKHIVGKIMHYFGIK